MSFRSSTLFKGGENLVSRIVQVPKYDGVSGIYTIFCQVLISYVDYNVLKSMFTVLCNS